MKIVLHIGAHSTGSTAIQSFLFHNRKAVAKQGVLYPAAHTKIFGHHPLAWSFGIAHAQREARLSADVIVKDILKEAAAAKPRSVVLSSEDFEFIGPKESLVKLKKLLQDFPVEIVMYVRRQDELLNSAYSQHVKMYETRFSGSIMDFYMKHNIIELFNFHRILNKWSSVFGDDPIRVRVYDKAAFPGGDIVADFLSFLGLEIDKIGGESRPGINKKLPPEAVEILRRSNRRQLSVRTRGTLIHALETVSSLDADEATLLSEQNRRDLMAHFSRTNAMVAKRWLGQDKLFAEEERPEPAGRAVYPPPSGNAERSVEALLDCLIETIERPQ